MLTNTTAKMYNWLFITMLVTLFLLLSAFTEKSVSAAGMVTDCSKFGPGTGTFQNALNGGGLVQFSCSGTITPTATILINSSSTVDATGFNVTISSEGTGSSVISLTNGLSLTLKGITLTNGFTNGNGGAIYNNGGFLNLEKVVIANSTASNEGGAIYSSGGKVSLSQSTLSTNVAGTNGGAIAMRNSSLSITGTTITNNRASLSGSGLALNATSNTAITNTNIVSNTTSSAGTNGGGIYNNSSVLTLTNSRINYHRAFSEGGGLYTITGTVTIINSEISYNTFSSRGGGIYSLNSTVILTDATLLANEVNEEGGGVLATTSNLSVNRTLLKENIANAGGGLSTNGGIVIITNSLFTSNKSQFVPEEGGGAIRNNGASLSIESTTLNDNQADYKGAGIFNKTGTLTVTNSTISTNKANNFFAVGGFYNQQGTARFINTTIYINSNFATTALLNFTPSGGGSPVATTTLTNTIVATTATAEGTLCSGTIINGGNNLQFPSSSCGASIPTAEPRLGTLTTANGGKTPTHALTNGSPAIGAGNPAVCSSLAANKDQRGATRLTATDPTCDIGAYEKVAVSLEKAFVPSVIETGGRTTLRFTLVNSGNFSLTNVSFEDKFPAQIQITATNPTFSTNCANATINAAPGGSTVTISGLTLAANTTCIISVTITSNQNGTWENITEPVFANETGVGAPSAVARLTVGTPCNTGVNTLVVNSPEDGTPGGCTVTLRQAVLNAKIGDTITFTPELASGTLQLTLNSNLNVGIGVKITADDCSQPITIAGNSNILLTGSNTLKGLVLRGVGLRANSTGNKLECSRLRM